MTLPAHPLFLDEIDARIAEAKKYGNKKAADFAQWQRSTVIRQHRARLKLAERKARAAITKATEGKQS